MDKRQIKKALANSLVGIKRVLEDCQSDDVDDPGDDSEPRRVAVDPASFQFTPSRASWKEQKSLFGSSASVSTSKRKGKNGPRSSRLPIRRTEAKGKAPVGPGRENLSASDCGTAI